MSGAEEARMKLWEFILVVIGSIVGTALAMRVLVDRAIKDVFRNRR